MGTLPFSLYFLIFLWCASVIEHSLKIKWKHGSCTQEDTADWVIAIADIPEITYFREFGIDPRGGNEARRAIR